MNGNLLDLSGKIDRKTVELFDTIASVAQSVSIPFFVVGATARDMILTYGYGIEATRATLDVDFAVQVADWDQYNKLKEGLMTTGYFKPSPKQRQRLIYKDDLRIDLIPFGAISGPDHSITWPPENDMKMNTLGFKEAYEHSLTVKFSSSSLLDIRFASLAGLALMKLISWGDECPGRNRDAEDLRFIMRNYLNAGNDERLFGKEIDIIDKLEKKGDFDFEKAGARLLGRDMAVIAIPESKKRLIEILEHETGEKVRYKLVEDMIDVSHGYSSEFEDNIDLLEELKAGILEGKKRGRNNKSS